PLYKKFFEQCVKHEQFKTIYVTVEEQAQLWPDAGEHCKKWADQELLTRLASATYDDLDKLAVREIYNGHLSSQDQDKVRERVQAVYAEQMREWLAGMKTAYDADPKG